MYYILQKIRIYFTGIPGILDGGRYLVEKRVHLVVNVCHSRNGPSLEDLII